LIHQNVGYVVLAELEHAGFDAPFAVAAATAVALLLAAALSRGIERPATRAIKCWYRAHSSTGTVLGVASGHSGV
jgi:peptidoglycan/LPS O-acetylase OafA/YrhL